MSTAGGIFVLLAFIHLLADLMLQTETMAKRKADESSWLLIIHSAVYAVVFIPFLALAFDGSVHLTATCVLTLMMSHGAIDTYTPIWVWARLVRKPQEMKEDPIGGFTLWSSKPYGMLLTHIIDQFMHGCFLVPVAVMIALFESNKDMAETIGTTSFLVSLGLAALSVATIFVWNKRVRPPPSNVSDVTDIEDDERPSMPSQHDI